MYRTNKLRLLHKLLGMKNLARHYDGERSSSERLWYTGYHVYSNREQVMNLFNKGKPLCCVIFPENGNEICVAHYSGVADDITCVVFSSCHPVVEDTGVVFITLNVRGSRKVTASKQERKKVGQFNAIMLPYLKGNKPHESMYTLVFSDWDVLHVTDKKLTKGPVRIAEKLHLDSLNADC